MQRSRPSQPGSGRVTLSFGMVVLTSLVFTHASVADDAEWKTHLLGAHGVSEKRDTDQHFSRKHLGDAR